MSVHHHTWCLFHVDQCFPVSSFMFCPTHFVFVLSGPSPWVTLEQYRLLVSVQGRLHSCTQCDYVTKDKSNMKKHLGKHTGDRPFSCGDCGASFPLKHHLNYHIRTHTGERPFSCGLCSASFAVKHNLNNHMRTHTGERPFPCDHCSASFSRKQDLARHRWYCVANKKL
ncbi:uncharacterized protein LOC119165021 isoform X1 [Rhipicephalus microplus]|uniref:uncharacterized protein LOC119165021 isoform X1 n=1 Tax=Rhipicephalus microplus TaxID=6941 RepID=UPI003F6B54CC